MRFIDSNVIAYAFYQNEFQDNCQKFIIEGGITDTLNLIEAFNIIENEVNRDFAITSLRSLLKSNITIVDVDLNTIFEALKKAQKYKKLKFLDLIHFNIALINNCEKIVSYDSDFDGLDIPRMVE